MPGSNRENHATSNLFMLILFTIGLVMTIFAAQAAESVPKTCTNPRVNLSINIILGLSIILLVLPVGQFSCQYICVDCQEVAPVNYQVIVMFVCVALIATSSTLIYGLNNDDKCSKDEEGKDTGNAKSFAITVLIISLILLLWYYYQSTHHYAAHTTY